MNNESMDTIKDYLKKETAANYARALDVQVGGSHYKGMKIQPFEYAMGNNFNAGQFGVLKYISRYKNKGGREDLRKAKHFLELLFESEYPGEEL